MRKFNFFAFVVFISFTASAQIKKGSILLGGQLYYSNSKTQAENLDQKSDYGSIGISLGKTFKENSAVGFNISFSPTSQTNIRYGTDTLDLTFNQFNIGAFFRKYKQLAKDFYFFAQVDGAFIMSNQKDNFEIAAGDVKTNRKGGFIALTPGISYQVFKKMQLELTIPNILGIQYMFTKLDSENPQVKDFKRTDMMFYSNLNSNAALGWLGVGFRFIL